MSTSAIQPQQLVAFDVHVHLEAPVDGSAADLAARQYFGESGAERDPHAIAEYYRSRRIAFVVFSVDERLTGRRQLPNDEVADFAAAHGARDPARLSAFPLVTVDYAVQLGDEHRYQLGVLIENSHGGQVQGLGVDMWFPSRLVAGAEGFTSGLGAKRVEGMECSGFRWRSGATLFVGDHVRICPTKDTKLGYRVNDDLYGWIDEEQPAAEFEVFVGTFPRLRALVPVARHVIFSERGFDEWAGAGCETPEGTARVSKSQS